MREHREPVDRGGQLIRAHAAARREAWLASRQRPDRIETREAFTHGKLSAIIAESRVDLAVPSELKDVLKEVFLKTNTETPVFGTEVGTSRFKSRVLVLVYKKPQNGIRGLPVTPAEGRKNRKEGFTHLAISYVPEGARESGLDRGQGYDESGWKICFYKPRGGHARDGEKGGELVREYQSELFILQFIFENGLVPLYGVPLVASWGYLPKTDETREEENAAAAAIQAILGRARRLHPESAYHRERLLAHFRELYRESAMDEAELEAKAQSAFAETVIGQTALERVSAGNLESHAYYLSDDRRLAYAIHNGRDGQYVLKLDLVARNVEVGFVRRDLNGNALMEFYDDFLTSNRFRSVTWHEFSAHASGIGMLDLSVSA